MNTNKEMIIKRLKIILSNEDMARIQIITGENTKIIVNVHGLICRQARRLIDNIINLLRTSFLLIIVHGYNHGTAIKDMLSNSFTNNHVFTKYPDPYNQGITYMQIA